MGRLGAMRGTIFTALLNNNRFHCAETCRDTRPGAA